MHVFHRAENFYDLVLCRNFPNLYFKAIFILLFFEEEELILWQFVIFLTCLFE